jgi:hypothetical protein
LINKDVGSNGPGTFLRDSLSSISALLAVAGVAIYGVLNLGYSRFYDALGLDPSDVGLNYVSVLARASGFVVGMLLFIFLASSIQAWMRYYTFADAWNIGKLALIPLPLIATILAIIFSFLISQSGISSAKLVKEGRPVRPTRSFYTLGFATLAIHADPAVIEATSKPEDASPMLRRLQGRTLLYLGRADGNTVLYDARIQAAVFLPSGSLSMIVKNCAARLHDQECNQS